ncbi:MAG: molybdopterin-synthase adenylyltransferase MoeB [Campylobacteraceae bacterium]|jgi:adenylyltransferase/sulfurtransferase|nr:molybdopterin-synthase adenylyltransferase MoeB [Campylobacteraceae bacterium]
MQEIDGLPELTQSDLTRYSRHIILPNVGLIGQKKLKNSKVCLVGAGALSSPIALYLGAAGVGTIGVIDFDEVDETNLQRQVIHTTKNIGKSKTTSIKEGILNINPNVNVITFNTKITSQNAFDILKNFDIIVDCTDNFPTRYLVNDACVMLKKPNVYGSIFRFEGQASVFNSVNGACYRCIFPTPPPPNSVPSCGEGGVFGVLPGVIGSIQATEVIKIILGEDKNTLVDRLLLYDALKMSFKEFKVKKDEHCPVCGQNPTITELIDYENFCGIKKTENFDIKDISTKELKILIDSGKKINLIDVREVNESNIAGLENVIKIPLNQLGYNIGKIDESLLTVVICKVGTRSKYAIMLLKESGFRGELLNLDGGILAWINEIDNSMSKY